MRRLPAFVLGTSLVGAHASASAALVAVKDVYTPTATTLTISAPGVLANDTGASGATSVVAVNVTGLQGSLAPLTSGGFSFTPNQGLATNTSFTYTARDAAGSQSTATVTLDMVSTLPSAAADAYTPTSPTLAVAAPAGLLANDTGGIGALRVVAVNVTGLQGSLAPLTSGGFTFTPNQGLATNTGFTYTLSDSLGRLSTSNVVFDMVSTLPTAVGDTYTPTSPTLAVAAAAGLLANDTGGAGPLRVVAVNVTGLQGSLAPLTSGGFSFTPNQGLATNTGFTYTLSDGLGRQSTANVVLDMVSTLPTAVNDVYTPNATTFTVAAPAGLLANDTGGAGPLRVAAVNVTGLKGALTPLLDGGFTFAPDAGLATNTGFAYTLTDALGRFRTANVLLDMVSSLPDGDDDMFTLATGGGRTLTFADLLGNDDGGLGPLSLTGVSTSTLLGTLTTLGSGGFLYTAPAAFVGDTSFSYTLRDALGRTSSALVTLHVGGAGDGGGGGNTVPVPASLALVLIALAPLCCRRRTQNIDRSRTAIAA